MTANFTDSVTFNVGSVTTTGDQTYSGTMTLGASTTLTGANLTLAKSPAAVLT